MNRKCGDWVKTYFEMTKEQESPADFHFYCSLFCISAALGRKVYVDKQYYRIYPNIYAILVGASGQVRKSSAINLAESLLRKAMPDVKLVAQKITPEAMLSALNKRHKEVQRSEAIVIAEELAVFLGSDVRNIPLIQLLTKLYNCQDVMDYETIGRGRETCERSFCTMLAGTTPEWMHQAFPSQATEGGFTGRCLFVYGDKPRRKIAWPHLDELTFTNMAEDLAHISHLSGAYTLTSEGRDWYTNWYEHDNQVENDDIKLDGYYARKQDTLLKVAMLLSASERDDMILTPRDLSAALRFIELNEKHLKKAMMAIHMTEAGAACRSVLRHIHSAGKEGIKHSELLKKMYYHMNATEFKEHIDTLLDGGLITRLAVNPLNGNHCRIYVANFAVLGEKLNGET